MHRESTISDDRQRIRKLIAEGSGEPGIAARQAAGHPVSSHVRHQRAATDEMSAAVLALPQQLSAAVDVAVDRALRRAADDPDFSIKFWGRGYTHMSERATKGISEWVGKRVLIILIAAALSASDRVGGVSPAGSNDEHRRPPQWTAAQRLLQETTCHGGACGLPCLSAPLPAC